MEDWKTLKIIQVESKPTREQLYDGIHEKGVYFSSLNWVKAAKFNEETGEVKLKINSKYPFELPSDPWVRGGRYARMRTIEKGEKEKKPIDLEKEKWNERKIFNINN